MLLARVCGVSWLGLCKLGQKKQGEGQVKQLSAAVLYACWLQMLAGQGKVDLEVLDEMQAAGQGWKISEGSFWYAAVTSF